MTRDNVALSGVLAWMIGTLTTLGATNYWDNNGATAGFGAAGGTWGIETKWSADSTGVSAPAVINTTASDDLVFGTASNGLATGTITVDGTNQAFHSITIGAASGAITISNGVLNLAAPASIVVGNNASNTIASVLVGTNGLNKAKPDAFLTSAAFLTSSSTVTHSSTQSKITSSPATQSFVHLNSCFEARNDMLFLS